MVNPRSVRMIIGCGFFAKVISSPHENCLYFRVANSRGYALFTLGRHEEAKVMAETLFGEP
ncbi:hypothetical protein [Coleofasciculus chthonoplastes]|uniref:hypothetical protein n=1 Tax=Coleofasciculus chthonoplastes TaxID=64178 RepID=UPI0032FE70AF